MQVHDNCTAANPGLSGYICYAGTWQPDHVDSTGHICNKFLAYGPQIHIYTRRTCMYHTSWANRSHLWNSPDWATASEMPGDKTAGFQPSALSKHPEELGKSSQERRRIIHLKNIPSNTTSSRNKYA